MRYNEYEIALSPARLNRYMVACRGNKKNFRNRIAHHEPVCFDVTGNINTIYACDNYQLILKYVRFFGYNPQELFYGMSTKPDSIISAIDTISTKV